MPFCINCGTSVNEGVKFCPNCGKEITASAEQKADTNGQQQNNFSAKISALNNTADNTAEFDKADIEQNKVMAILSYLSWLVLVPIFAAPKSKFARFHANQGVVLAITEAAYWIVEAILSGLFFSIFSFRLFAIYTLLSFVLYAVNVVFLILSIIGIANAANGRAKKLPIIGKFTILK